MTQKAPENWITIVADVEYVLKSWHEEQIKLCGEALTIEVEAHAETMIERDNAIREIGELGRRLGETEHERDALQAQVAELRAALECICQALPKNADKALGYARKALAKSAPSKLAEEKKR